MDGEICWTTCFHPYLPKISLLKDNFSRAVESPALFQNIFKFCTFLSKFSNILPCFALFKHFFLFFGLLLKNCMHALSRIGPDVITALQKDKSNPRKI